MTRQELLIAAKAARTYPVGEGFRWGYGPLLDCRLAEDAVAVIEEQRWLSRYG